MISLRGRLEDVALPAAIGLCALTLWRPEAAWGAMPLAALALLAGRRAGPLAVLAAALTIGLAGWSVFDLSRILRPAFGVLLLALAWLGRAESFASGRAVLLAVAACTAADVALGTGRARPGRVGVLGYAVCHLGFLAALFLVPTERSTLGWVVGAVVAAVCSVAIAVLLWPVLQTAAPAPRLPLWLSSATYFPASRPSSSSRCVRVN